MKAISASSQRQANDHAVEQAAHLRKLQRTQFVQWSVGALGGKWRAGWGRSRGFQGNLVVWPKQYRALDDAPLEKCRWYPIQVKQKNKVGRPDIDAFEAVMMREDCDKGFFVGFDFSSDAVSEINAFFKRTRKVIIALSVREILDEEIAMKMA